MQLHIVHVGDFSGLEYISYTCGRTMHVRMMHRGFTVLYVNQDL